LEVIDSYSGSIDLLITDVVMPEMGGRELAAALAESRPEIKVLYTSGYADDAIVQHGLLEAGSAFLQKPYSPTKLVAKVVEILTALRRAA
jgi:CheY-like chemotaxis protein